MWPQELLVSRNMRTKVSLSNSPRVWHHWHLKNYFSSGAETFQKNGSNLWDVDSVSSFLALSVSQTNWPLTQTRLDVQLLSPGVFACSSQSHTSGKGRFASSLGRWNQWVLSTWDGLQASPPQLPGITHTPDKGTNSAKSKRWTE